MPCSAPPTALPDGGGPGVEDAAGDELSIRQAMNMEKFYQAMQDVHHVVRFLVAWTRGAPTLDDSIRAMLPRSLHEHTTVASAPHALAMLDQIFQALPSAQSAHTVYLKGAYYETASVLSLPDSLPPVATVDDDSLRTADVIVMEPHPNNAALHRIEPHDPVALISNVMTDDRTKPLTLIMDVTLSHLRDDDIQRTLGAVQPYTARVRRPDRSGSFELRLQHHQLWRMRGNGTHHAGYRRDLVAQDLRFAPANAG